MTTDTHNDLVLRAGSERAARWAAGERLEQIFEERCDWLGLEGLADHSAVSSGGTVLTYDQLDRRANQLARHLRSRGARPGDRVALLFDEACRSYVAMLAVLKLNAAYVPLDVGFPPDRLAYITGDAGVGLVLSLSHLRGHLEDLTARLVCLDEADPLVDAVDGCRLTESEKGAPVDELAYIIYTSGSTGRPKGVAIEHASICNFVRVAAEAYGLQSRDRVYQGMTIAFDFSVEEIWVPWAVGATLVPKPAGASLLGQELGEFLTEHEVSALCCVPTLLATVEEDLPALRFLLVSGEACPQDLIARWHRPGRRFLNVYGPTEATVTATWSVVHPGRPVTLGRPLPTYSVLILDPDDNRALPAGELGEIGIAGIGLATGYVNRPDLTAKAFIADFVGIDDNPSGRIYRSGDLGIVNEHGEIEYHGRIDTQVKIRGYRIELTEIESVLLQVPGVAAAVVDTFEPQPGLVELVAYYSVRKDSAGVAPRVIQELMRGRLPGYMVPAYFEELTAIPMLPSDKADRKNLPAPRCGRNPAAQDDYVAPGTDIERALAEVLAGVLRAERVSAQSHFFNDLGANSLTMATFCARVREHGSQPSLAMKDIYLHPTVASLAAAVEPSASPAAADQPSGAARAKPPAPASTARYLLCGALQLLLFLLSAAVAASIWMTGLEWVAGADGLVDIWQRTVLLSTISFLGLAAAPVIAKWTLIGRWKPQEIPIWSLAYVRFWLVKSLIRANPMRFFVGSPLYVLYLRALGAKIGRNVAVFSVNVPVCTDLLTIGDGTVIRKDAAFACYRAQAGRIQVGPVSLGAGAYVGEATVLDIDTSMGDGSQLGHSSALHAGQEVPAGQRWHGSPAQRTDVDYLRVHAAPCGAWRRVAYTVLQLTNRLVLFVPGVIAVITWLLSGHWDSEHLTHTSWTFYRDLVAFSLALFVAGVLAALTGAMILPRLLNRFLRPDVAYPLYGSHYAIQRATARLTNSRFFMELFGDSSYIVPYLRALGYDLSRVEQTGSNFGVALKHESPYLSTVGTGTMVSDGLSIVNADFSSSSFRVSRVSVGARSFFGNNIIYPIGGRTGDNCLLATKVMIPLDGPVREGVGLLGSPCFEIPRSVQRDRGSDEFTSAEEMHRRLAAKNRHNAVTIGAYLFTRWLYLLLTMLFASVAAAFYEPYGVLAVALLLAFQVVFTAAYFVLVERAAMAFRPLRPLFCSIYERPFWQHERFWKLSATGYLEIFNGTPFKTVIWRLLGVRLGRRVFDDGCAIPEKTLVCIGDDCTLNALATIQCHSMEDGAFKSDGIVIGAGVTIGVNAFVHYGVAMAKGSVLECDAFLMKGAEVEVGAHWRGNPASESATVVAEALTATRETARNTDDMQQLAASLLASLRTAPAPQLSPSSGITLSLFSLAACRRRESELVRFLTAAEKEQALSMGSRQRRTAFVASRALARILLSTVWRPGVDPLDWRFGRTDSGKMTIQRPAMFDIDLSISYTERVLAVAVSDSHDVGVDVEPARRCGNDPVVWSVVLSLAEQNRLAETAAPERPSQFMRMWTLKEALAKCLGKGVGLDFGQLHTSFAPLGVLPEGRPGNALEPIWFYQEEWELDREPYLVAIAAKPKERHRPLHERNGINVIAPYDLSGDAYR